MSNLTTASKGWSGLRLALAVAAAVLARVLHRPNTRNDA